MSNLKALLFSVAFWVVFAFCAFAFSDAGRLSASSGHAPATLEALTVVIAAITGFVYWGLFRAVVVAPVLQDWADDNGMKLLKIERSNASKAPASLRIAMLQRNKYQAYYWAWARSSAGTMSKVYFRLSIFALTGYVSIQDTAVHEEGVAPSSA